MQNPHTKQPDTQGFLFRENRKFGRNLTKLMIIFYIFNMEKKRPIQRAINLSSVLKKLLAKRAAFKKRPAPIFNSKAVRTLLDSCEPREYIAGALFEQNPELLRHVRLELVEFYLLNPSRQYVLGDHPEIKEVSALNANFEFAKVAGFYFNVTYQNERKILDMTAIFTEDDCVKSIEFINQHARSTLAQWNKNQLQLARQMAQEISAILKRERRILEAVAKIRIA